MDASQVLAACRRLAAAMDGFDADAARRIGVNRTDLRALNLLENGPVSQAAIATALGITRPSVTTLVDRLERAGLVRRLPDPEDRRATLVELLPATWQAFAHIYQPVGQRVLAVADEWDDEQRRVVAGALDAVAAVFESESATEG